MTFSPREALLREVIHELTEAMIDRPDLTMVELPGRGQVARPRAVPEAVSAAIALIRSDRARRPSEAEQHEALILDRALAAGRG